MKPGSNSFSTTSSPRFAFVPKVSVWIILESGIEVKFNKNAYKGQPKEAKEGAKNRYIINTTRLSSKEPLFSK